MDLVVPLKLFVATTVASTGSVTSGVIDTRLFARLESLLMTMTSTASAHDVKVVMQGSDSPTGTFTDAVDGYGGAIVDSTATTFPNSAADTIALSLPPVLAPYIRFVVTGVGANPADTALTATLYGREDI